ncbi:glycoside hydrolase family 95-like protein [Thermocatellispora tengchongensis]
MLLQSHGDQIHLLAALPAQWPDGAFSGLLARGGFEVDLEWRGGDVHRGEIRSRLGRKVTLRTPAPVTVTSGGRPVPVERPEPNVVVFDTRPSGAYEVRPGA